MIRILALGALLVLALFTPFWVFVLGAALYAFFVSPYEPLLVAVLIDAQFGDIERAFPYLYTVVTLVLLLVIRAVRPRFTL